MAAKRKPRRTPDLEAILRNEPNDDELDALFAPAAPKFALETDEHVDPDESLDSTPNLERIFRWLSQGVSRKAVAAIFRLKLDEFEERCEELARLDETVRRAEGVGEKRAAAALWKLIDDPEHREHARAAQFFLKTRAWAPEPKAKEVTPEVAAEEPQKELSREEITRLLREGAGLPPLQKEALAS